MIVPLLISAFCNAFLAVILSLLEKKTAFGRANYAGTQLLIGVLFGLMAVYSSTPWGGFDIGDGTIMNVRDASPLCAGLIFGAPAGIIAGIIGGVYRYVATFWGLAGTYTQLACSLSTIMAGLIAALLRKYMFDNKKPTWVYGIAIGIVCEILHMLMIFITNLSDTATAFSFVQKCTIPMALSNGAAVGISIFAVRLLSEKKRPVRGQKQISQTFQSRLFICILVAFVMTGSFTFLLETNMSLSDAESEIMTNIQDVRQDIIDASDQNLLDVTNQVAASYNSGNTDLFALAKIHNVSEINVVDKTGIITDSTRDIFIGYQMADGTQSAEFLPLLHGKTQHVQPYQPTSFDRQILQKYAAVTLPEGGFIQVGYDAVRFRDDIEEQVVGATKNRHIGTNGFMIICDEDFNIVSNRYGASGENLFAQQLTKESSVAENTVFEASVSGETYLCAYSFSEGYYIIGVTPKSEALFIRDTFVYISSFMQLLIFATLFILVYFLVKLVILNNLQKVNQSLAQITNGNLNVTVDVRSNEEFASLSDDINSTVSTLKRYIAEAAARFDTELEFAKQIQHSSLPASAPDESAICIYADMVTAKEVGGDFYDYYMLDDSRLAFLVADVSGKGIPAAMFMMKAKTIIKDLAENGLTPDEIFTVANEKLCENNEAGMFVTAWMGILDISTGLLQFANAGHNPPLFCPASGEFSYMKTRSGLVLAGMEGIRYRKNELTLSPGDRFYLYTDGVTEATNHENALYGEERLLSLVNSAGNVSPKELCQRVKCDVDNFVGTAPQFDDITMLSVTLYCIRSDKEIHVVPNEASRSAVNDFADALASRLAVLPKISHKINIIFDEIYTNILSYSNATEAHVSYEIAKGKLTLTFRDNGIPYNPTEAPEPDITLSAEERDIGGLGIFMVKNMAEHMEYRYDACENVITIVIALEA